MKYKNRMCSVCELPGYSQRNGVLYCKKHYDRAYVYGSVEERPSCQNYITEENGMTFMVCINRKGERIISNIDAEDIPRIKQHKWSMMPAHSYMYIGGIAGKLHRFILSAPKGSLIDHINGNTLDNRKANLRITTHKVNTYNQRLRSDNRTGITGVSIYHRLKKKNFRVKIDDKHIGYTETIREAIELRKNAEGRFYGGITTRRNQAGESIHNQC